MRTGTGVRLGRLSVAQKALILEIATDGFHWLPIKPSDSEYGQQPPPTVTVRSLMTRGIVGLGRHPYDFDWEGYKLTKTGWTIAGLLLEIDTLKATPHQGK
jgi:hypothetical protein